MATTKQRINISVTDEAVAILERIARRDDVPVATKARELLELGLQIEEDDVLNAIAASRDTKGARYLGHRKVWR